MHGARPGRLRRSLGHGCGGGWLSCDGYAAPIGPPPRLERLSGAIQPAAGCVAAGGRSRARGWGRWGALRRRSGASRAPPGDRPTHRVQQPAGVVEHGQPLPFGGGHPGSRPTPRAGRSGLPWGEAGSRGSMSVRPQRAGPLDDPFALFERVLVSPFALSEGLRAAQGAGLDERAAFQPRALSPETQWALVWHSQLACRRPRA